MLPHGISKDETPSSGTQGRVLITQSLLPSPASSLTPHPFHLTLKYAHTTCTLTIPYYVWFLERYVFCMAVLSYVLPQSLGCLPKSFPCWHLKIPQGVAQLWLPLRGGSGSLAWSLWVKAALLCSHYTTVLWELFINFPHQRKSALRYIGLSLWFVGISNVWDILGAQKMNAFALMKVIM